MSFFDRFDSEDADILERSFAVEGEGGDLLDDIHAGGDMGKDDIVSVEVRCAADRGVETALSRGERLAVVLGELIELLVGVLAANDDIELASVRAVARVLTLGRLGGGYGTGDVEMVRRRDSRERVARAVPADGVVLGGVAGVGGASLDEEVGHDAVEEETVVVAIRSEADKVVTELGDVVVEGEAEGAERSPELEAGEGGSLRVDLVGLQAEDVDRGGDRVGGGDEGVERRRGDDLAAGVDNTVEEAVSGEGTVTNQV